MLAEWARAALNSCGFGFKDGSFFFARSLFVNSSSFCSSLVSSNLSARPGPEKHAIPAPHRHARTAKRSRVMTPLHSRCPREGSRHRELVEDALEQVFRGEVLGLGLVSDDDAVAQHVVTDRLDVLRRDVATAVEKGLALGGAGQENS